MTELSNAQHFGSNVKVVLSNRSNAQSIMYTELLMFLPKIYTSKLYQPHKMMQQNNGKREQLQVTNLQPLHIE